MNDNFKLKWQGYVEVFENFAQNELGLLAHSRHPAIKNLSESVSYSFSNGGKRFRPVLSLSVCEMLGGSFSNVLPYAMAVEMVHTYSLIHDDLPCMDNDDIRRNQPTNHKVYGETVALLAGDTLLTEAFKMAAKSEAKPENLVQLIGLLANLSGINGMVGGQAMDLYPINRELEINEILEIHKCKTGALISAASLGAAMILDVDFPLFEKIKKYSEHLGLAFQVKDDLLDADENDPINFVSFMGADKTKQYLETLTKSCIDSLNEFGPAAGFLRDIATYNLLRTE